MPVPGLPRHTMSQQQAWIQPCLHLDPTHLTRGRDPSLGKLSFQISPKRPRVTRIVWWAKQTRLEGCSLIFITPECFVVSSTTFPKAIDFGQVSASPTEALVARKV